MSNSTGSKEIPEDIQEWIKETAKEICKKTKLHSEPDIIIEHGDYSIAGLFVCKEIAERLFFKLQEEKPKGMLWRVISDPPPSIKRVVLVWVPTRRMPFMATWHGDEWTSEYDAIDEGITHWRELPDGPESPESSDDLSALQSENERLKGERDEYRRQLSDLADAMREAGFKTTPAEIAKLLSEYPNPTT